MLLLGILTFPLTEQIGIDPEIPSGRAYALALLSNQSDRFSFEFLSLPKTLTRTW